MPSGDNGSLAFYNWFVYEFWRFVFVQQEVGKLAQTALEFPPMQKGASFNLEAVKQQIDKAMQSHGRQVADARKSERPAMGRSRPALFRLSDSRTEASDHLPACLPSRPISSVTPSNASPAADMIWIPGGSFRMGSDRHYPEEAPVHRVTVDGFWIDPTPVTNAQFRKFVEATGYVTWAEIAPDPKDYPGALPHMLKAGGLVFTPPKKPVDLGDWSQWWNFTFGANWRRPYGKGSHIGGLDDHPVVQIAYKDAEAYARWAGKELPTEAEWEFAARGGLDGAEFAWGEEFTPGGKHMANTWQGNFPLDNDADRRLRPHLAGARLSGQRLRRARHDRQCLGMDDRLVFDPAHRRRAQGLLRAGESARRRDGGELRPAPARRAHPAQGAEGRLASLRAQLLPALSPRGAPRRAGRHLDQPCRLPLHRQGPQRRSPGRGPPMTRLRRIAAIVTAAVVVWGLGGSLQAFGQTAPATSADPASPWAFRITPYGWLTWMSGSQTVKGRTVDTNTNVFELLGESQSLIPFMVYTEARYQDRISLFVDVMYANITAGEAANRNFRVNRFVSGSIAAAASVDYEQLTVQFGGAYEFAELGRDRSAEGPGMAGVGQTALDLMVGGRYWYQKADLALNLNGTLGVNVGDLERSRDGSRAVARSGSVSWVDPFIGFRARHRLAPGQELMIEADIGGFSIGSVFSWQSIAAYSFEFGKTGGVRWAGVVGYRALYVDYVQGSGRSLFETNLLQHGPLVGLSARF